MKKYNVYFSEEELDFVIDKFDEEKTERVQLIPALSGLDNKKFNRIIVKNNYIRFISDTTNTSLRIDNVEEFIKKGYFKYLPNAFHKIKRRIAKIDNLKQYVKSPIKGNVRIAVGMLSLILLGGATSVNALNNSKIDDSIIEYNIEPIEEDNIEKENIVTIEEEVQFDDNVEQIQEDANSNETVIDLNYKLTNDLKKKDYAFNKYYDVVEFYATKWGVDPRLIMAILTQESGGKDTNLMQIEFNAWEGTLLHAYNFIDGKYENFLLSNDPNMVSNEKRKVITQKDLENKITNISIGTCLFYKAFKESNNNIINALLLYNQGTGNMNKIYNAAYENTGFSKEDFLMDPTNLEFLKYTGVTKQGDPFYPYNVLRFLDDPSKAINIEYLDDYENPVSVAYNITYQDNDTLSR